MTAGSPPPRVRWREQLVAVTWMTLVWNLFWGKFTWGNLVGGGLVAVAILVLYPLPPVTFAGRVRPAAVVVLAARFAQELVLASIQLSWTAFRPGHRARGAIIAVRLRVRTDLNLALTAEVLSLVPGTLIVEVDREAGILYVHVFDVRGAEDLATSRRRIYELETRLVRAIGSADEVRRVRSSPAGGKGVPE